MSKKKKTVAELEKENRMLRAVIDQVPGHVYWKDVDNRYLGFNKEQLGSLGFSSVDEGVGKTATEVIQNLSGIEEIPERGVEIDRVDQEILDTGKATVVEEATVKFDGSRCVYLSKKVPYIDEAGRVAGVIGATQNITAYKNLQHKLADLNKLLQALIELNDKQLRNPVGNIIGTCEYLLLEHKNDKKASVPLNDIYESANKVLPILDRVDFYLRIISDTELGLAEQFNFNDFFIHTITKIAKTLPKKTKIHFHQEQAFLKEVFADHATITEIINTLFRYAAHFSLSGELRCSLRIEDGSLNGRVLRLKLYSDNTSLQGIDKAEVFNIFENVTDNHLVDHSLELTILNRLCERMGATIDYMVKPEHTIFTLSIPVDEAAEPVSKELFSVEISCSEQYEFDKKAVEQFRQRTANKAKAKILLVEDDPICRKVLQVLLGKLISAEIVEAHSCAMLTGILQQGGCEFDLVLLDVNLPDGSSLQVLKKFNQALSNANVVMLSANNLEKSAQESQILADHRVRAVYQKPVTLINLCEILSYYVLNQTSADR